MNLEEEKKHPIDVKIDAMIEKDGSTHGQIRAQTEGCKLWDAELNRVYKKFYGQLPATGKSRLQSSQRAWLAFRDAEFKLLDVVFNKPEGTMYLPMRVGSRLALVKRRAQELERLRELAIGG